MTKPFGFPGIIFEVFVLGQTWIFETLSYCSVASDLRQMMNNPAMMQQVPVSSDAVIFDTERWGQGVLDVGAADDAGSKHDGAGRKT